MMVFASLSWAGEDAAPHPAISVKGEVLEVKVVENFTYLRLKTQNGETWAAVVNAQARKGEMVTIENVSVMENFESRSLKRTFKTILFGTLGGAGKGSTGSATLGAAFSANPAKLDTINDAPFPKPAARTR
jgi:hypothetical protein